MQERLSVLHPLPVKIIPGTAEPQLGCLQE